MIASNVLAVALAIADASAAPLAKRSSGQATFYDAGLGACGWTNSASDFVIAMNAPEWSGGSHCGQTVTITNTGNGNTQTAQVADLCPGCSYGSLDMSTGLFSALNNGNMDAGVFPISWSFGSGSGASQNNQQQAAQQQQQQQQTSSTPAPQVTYTPDNWTPSSTATPTTPTWTPSAPAPAATSQAPAQPASATADKTVVSTPQWWNKIDNICGIDLAPKSIPIAISSSSLLAEDKLSNACGKWIQIKNNANGKQLSLQVTNYFNGTEGDVGLTEAYRILADDYHNPETIKSVTWGFIEGQGM